MNRKRFKSKKHKNKNNVPSESFLKALEEQRKHQTESQETKEIHIQANDNYIYDNVTHRYYKKPKIV